jgi:hypothetical protein
LLANPKQKDKKKLHITPSGRRRWQWSVARTEKKFRYGEQQINW